MLVAERRDRRLHAGRGRLGAEQVDEPGLQLVDVEVGGVDDDVGLALHRLEQRRARARSPRARCRRRRPAGACGGCCRSGARARRRRPRGTAMRTTVAGRRGAGPTTSRMSAWCGPLPTTRARRSIVDAGRAGQLDHLLDERGRQVVDDEPAEVLEVVGRLRAARPRQPGDHDDVGHRCSGYRRSERELQVASCGCGGTAGGGSWRPRRTPAARARKPGGGRRLLHPLDQQAVGRPARSRSG